MSDEWRKRWRQPKREVASRDRENRQHAGSVRSQGRSKECNKLLGRNGEFWRKETFDRFVPNEKHYHNAIAYIENNPVKAGLCERSEDWKWSSASRRLGAHASSVLKS